MSLTWSAASPAILLPTQTVEGPPEAGRENRPMSQPSSFAGRTPSREQDRGCRVQSLMKYLIYATTAAGLPMEEIAQFVNGDDAIGAVATLSKLERYVAIELRDEDAPSTSLYTCIPPA